MIPIAREGVATRFSGQILKNRRPGCAGATISHPLRGWKGGEAYLTRPLLSDFRLLPLYLQTISQLPGRHQNQAVRRFPFHVPTYEGNIVCADKKPPLRGYGQRVHH